MESCIRRYERPDGAVPYRQILVPKSVRQRFLDFCYADITSGQFGVRKIHVIYLLVRMEKRRRSLRAEM